MTGIPNHTRGRAPNARWLPPPAPARHARPARIRTILAFVPTGEAPLISPCSRWKTNPAVEPLPRNHPRRKKRAGRSHRRVALCDLLLSKTPGLAFPKPLRQPVRLDRLPLPRARQFVGGVTPHASTPHDENHTADLTAPYPHGCDSEGLCMSVRNSTILAASFAPTEMNSSPNASFFTHRTTARSTVVGAF